MTQPTRVAAAAALLLVSLGLVGCGGDDEPKAATPTASETTTAALPKVSEKTTCDLLFGGDQNPMNDATDMVGEFATDPDATSVDQAKASDLADAIRSIAASAPETLAPHLEAEADFLENLNDVAATGSVSFDQFKSSGLEISNVCVPLL